MKRILTFSLCVVSFSMLFVGCSGEESSDQPAVNSGSLNEEYVGDADIVIIEDFKQTPNEADAQKELLKQLEEDGELLNTGGLSTY